MRRAIAIGLLLLAACAPTSWETLEVELTVIAENPADPEWRDIFQEAANARCVGPANVSDDALTFTAPIDGHPPTMSGRYRCK